MPAPIIDDELWALIEPLLPPPKPRRKRYLGRLPVSDHLDYISLPDSVVSEIKTQWKAKIKDASGKPLVE